MQKTRHFSLPPIAETDALTGVVPVACALDDVVIPASGPSEEPPAQTDVSARFLDLYRHMVTAREIDRLEEEYTTRGDAFFNVTGAGHESVAAIASHLRRQDYLHCHYRDKALLVARGVPPIMFFYSLFCKEASHSHGRQMSAHMSDSSTNIMSQVGPVGNHALQAVGIAREIRNREGRPCVLCAMGDGTSQQGEVLEAIAEAVRWELPVLFLIEDNRYAISTRTAKKTFYSLPEGRAESFYGIPIEYLDGTDAVACDAAFARIVSTMRSTRRPSITVMSVERLRSHTNADNQNQYRSSSELEWIALKKDPLKNLRAFLIQRSVACATIDQLETAVRTSVEQAAEAALLSRDPELCLEVKAPPGTALSQVEYTGHQRHERLTMLQAMRQVLRERMQSDERVTLYGQDIEDPKGDVFGLTKGLSTLFPKRVTNAPLSESTIVGTSIGRALAGGRPVGFLQFADFLPLAFNQIASELGTMHWRTAGRINCPVILLITCGGYRPGLGPFHAQSFESVAVHTPGIDVAMPSTAGDAAGMLNTAFDSKRPTLFFYPKSCLNLADEDATTSTDTQSQRVPLGIARIRRSGSDITFVAYGNAVERCLAAARVLEREGIEAEIVDLRWLSPWDRGTVLESVRKTRKLVVVHEDNLSNGVGSEIAAYVAESEDAPVKIRRVARADTFVPCNFTNQLAVLPSGKAVLEAGADLLDCDVEWILPDEQDKDVFLVSAIGTGPSDETVLVTDIAVTSGETVEKGRILASLEASKSAFDLESPVSGVVTEIVSAVGEQVIVGEPLFRIRVDGDCNAAARVAFREESGTPRLQRRMERIKLTASASPQIFPAGSPVRAFETRIGIIGLETAYGSNSVANRDLLDGIQGHQPEDVVRRTGIESRHWLRADETVLTIAIAAARAVLEQCQVDIRGVDLVIASTGTPEQMTPSLSCQVLYGLAGNSHECAAFDINAACSGYLYALQSAYLFLTRHPGKTALVLTAETLSRLLDPTSFDTKIIFADGATATLLRSESRGALLLNEPRVGAVGEPKESLYVPTGNQSQHISMNGKRIFAEGARRMTEALRQACGAQGIDVADLDLIIPHQANQRLIDAIGRRLRCPEKLCSNIKDHGNTSSSSIPICLHENWERILATDRIGITAFGGGFTYGAAILETP